MDEKMKWEAHPEVLDKTKAKRRARRINRVLCPLVEEIIAYGTQAYKRAYAKADRETQYVIVSIFLKVVEMMDGVHMLFREAICTPANVLLRAEFESLLSLEYVLKEDTDRRARCYIFMSLLEQLDDYELFHGDTEKGVAFRSRCHEKGINLAPDREADITAEECRARIESIDFEEIRSYYDALPKGVRNSVIRPAWYSLLKGPKNLYFLAKECQRELQYECLYPEWSRTAHGKDVYRVLHKHTAQSAYVRLRDCIDHSTMGYFAVVFGLDAILHLTANALPDEMDTLSEWLHASLRDRYQWLAKQ